MKKVVVLLSFFIAINLSGKSWKSIDLYRKITQPISVNIERLENPHYVSNILNKLSRAIKVDPYNKYLRLLRFEYSMIMWDILPQKSKGKFAKIAMEWADEDIKLFPEEPSGWEMRGMFLGAFSLSIGTLNALQFALRGKQLMERAYLLSNPGSFSRAFAAAMLGRMYFKLPPFPVSFGDMAKAEVYLREATKIEPENIYYQVFLAELLAYIGRKNEAMQIVKRLPYIKVKRWYQLIGKRWTLRTYKTIVAVIKSGVKGEYSKYTYDFLLDPERHPENSNLIESDLFK